MDTNFHLLPQQASSTAVQVDHLVYFVLGVSAFFTLLISTAIVYFAIRYRRRGPGDRPPRIPGSTMLEVVWTVIPMALTMIIFVWGAQVFVSARRVQPDAMEIFVIGKQWMWQVQHPEGRREINMLHLPLGKPIHLTLTSQDVIHDFSIPAFRIKQDVRPGSYSSEEFTPTRIGQYHLFCDQYCGAKHAEMIGTVVVMEPAQYAHWLAGDASNVPPRVAGRKLFSQYGCSSCHGQYAPTLAGLYGSNVEISDQYGRRQTVLVDESYLRESILYPVNKLVAGYPNRMPSFKNSLSEEQLFDLVEYVKSLSGSAAPSQYVGPPRGASTQPGDFQPAIQNPPFSSYRANP